MDVSQDCFLRALLAILKHLLGADFVSLDLEMSGITIRAKGSDGERRAGKPSHQEAYDEMRQAAEKYQVLQIGITCVEAIIEKGESIPFLPFCSPQP